jgi:hypothetical protein
MHITQQTREAFEARYTPEPNCGCWLWTGPYFKDRGGYGAFFNYDPNAKGSKKKTYRAHRASWHLHHGPIARDQYVCHRCDTPACVNPAHLFLGSQAVNMADAKAKGRNARGAKIPRSKLTPDDVRAIRSDPRGPTAVGQQFAISARRVCEIRKGTRWGYVV